MATLQHTVCAPAQRPVFLPRTTENDAFLDSFNASVPKPTLYMCSVCFAAHLDPQETKLHTVDGWHVCQACIQTCEFCGEYLDDTLPVENGPVVRFRRWENDGQLSEPTCAACAADWLLSVWSDHVLRNPSIGTRETIAVIVAGQLEKAVA